MHIGSDHVVGCMARFGNGLALHRMVLGPKFRVGGQGLWCGGLKRCAQAGEHESNILTNAETEFTNVDVHQNFITNP